MAMSRMEELPTPNSGTFAIQETMSVGFTPMTDDGIVSPWLTKELERLFPFAPQRKMQPYPPSSPSGDEHSANMLESRAGYVELLNQTRNQCALLHRQSNFSDAGALEKVIKWLVDKVEEIDLMRSYLQRPGPNAALPLSPTSPPIGIPQESPRFRFPASSYSPPPSTSSALVSSPNRFVNSRSLYEGGAVVASSVGDESGANSPATYAIALSSLSARGKPPYFPDESGKNNKNMQDIDQGGVLCNFCRNNGEREAMYRSHCLKDAKGRVLCPVLANYTCPKCGARGENAHTIKYCPVSAEKARLATLKVLALNHDGLARIGGGDPFADVI